MARRAKTPARKNRVTTGTTTKKKAPKAKKPAKKSTIRAKSPAAKKKAAPKKKAPVKAKPALKKEKAAPKKRTAYDRMSKQARAKREALLASAGPPPENADPDTVRTIQQFIGKNSHWWAARSSAATDAIVNFGRPPVYDDPDELWANCLEYFKWNDDHPLWEVKIVSGKKGPEQVVLPKLRAMTISMMQMYIGVSNSKWDELRAKPDFMEVCEVCERAIYNQKLAGAAAGLLNHAIIARELGLVDKKAADVTNTNNVTYNTQNNITVEMKPEEASRAYRDLIQNTPG